MKILILIIMMILNKLETMNNRLFYAVKKEIGDLWRIYKVEGGGVETVTNCNGVNLSRSQIVTN